MKITTASIAGKIVVFDSILDEVPGGAGLNVARLDSLTVGKEYIETGTPVYVDQQTRIAEVCKSTIALTGSTGTAIRVPKKNHYKVDDILNDGTTSAKINSINTSNAAYDILNLSTSLVSTENTKYVEGTVTGTNVILRFTPNGLIKSSTYIKDGNADVPVVTIGQVREAALPYPLTAAYKIALRGGTAGTGTSLITVI